MERGVMRGFLVGGLGIRGMLANLVAEPLFSAPDGRAFLLAEPPGSAVDRRAYFLLASPRRK
jgi:hypothetical protein